MASVSVVIPCYCCSETIERAVRSVVEQTVRPEEVIIVDDASKSGSLERLRELQFRYGENWIRILALNSNVGPAGARNAGWNAAGGELVAFLDADDAWHVRKLEIQGNFMSRHSEFGFSGHAHRVLRASPSNPAAPELGYREITRPQLLWSNRFTTSSIMVRRALRWRFRDGQRHMEDHLLWLMMVCDGQRAARLAAALSYRFSAPFGEAGLSGNLLKMERAELGNYWRLYRSGGIGAAWLGVLVPWSLLKFARRVVVSISRRLMAPRR